MAEANAPNIAPSALADPTAQPVLTFPVDVEHAGIRLALPVITIVAFVGLATLLGNFATQLSPESGLNCLAWIVAVFVAVGLAALADRVLKRIWPSGRELTLTDQAVILRDARRAGSQITELQWAERINVLAWRFVVRRGSARVQKGWVMLGCQLLQDDDQITIYTFMPAKEADAPPYADFVPLVTRDVLEKGTLGLREANQQRRLLRAEAERWQDGAELRRADYAQLIDALIRRIPNWSQPHTS